MEDGAGGRISGEASPKRKEVIAVSIFRTHVRRIGAPRTFIGGFLMYLSYLEFIFIHLTSIIVLYSLMIAPMFKTKRFHIRDYVILDRGRIAGMTRFDRVNCEFCGYANGTTKLWNDELDAIAAADLGKGKILRKLVVAVYAACLAVFSVCNFLLSKVLFAVISLFLGYHMASTRSTRERLRAEGYANAYLFPMRALIRFAKIYAETLLTNLEQIESGWCPLRHLERAGAVVPAHHERFYRREDLGRALEVLARDGTVSPRKPRY
jgi:uncharacterized membrane protein